jgi:hypothetical protein
VGIVNPALPMSPLEIFSSLESFYEKNIIKQFIENNKNVVSVEKEILINFIGGRTNLDIKNVQLRLISMVKGLYGVLL